MKWSALGASTLALFMVAGVSMATPSTELTSSSGASTLPTCSSGTLQVSVVFNGHGDPNGAMVLNTNSNGTCMLSGQPALKVFNSLNQQVKLTESKFHFSPDLQRPTAPILLSRSAPWAVVEMSWCGLPMSYSRIGVRFSGWKESLTIKATSFAPISFIPPACPYTRNSHLAVDFVRKLTLTVSPNTNLRSGEQVKVTVTGFGLGAKFFLSECAGANDVSDGGCGPQWALQPFGLANMIGSGSYTFVVRSTAASEPFHLAPSYRCSNNCVLMATGGGGGSVSYSRLSFDSR
jgi:hypothetical protein